MAFKFAHLFNKSGEYLPDPEPVVLAPAFDRPLTLQEQMARLIRDPNFVRQFDKDGQELESFEEADDFDIDDDYDPQSPWEENFDYAAVHGMERGVVRPFTPEEVTRARDTHEKAKKGFFRKKKPSSDTPLPESPSLSPQGLASDEGASVLPPSKKKD